jgi:hypothetical protein
MRVVNERERLVPGVCPGTRETVFFRFQRHLFAAPAAPLPCPACHRDHADWARRLAHQNGLDGWRVELHAGPVPRGGHEMADHLRLA